MELWDRFPEQLSSFLRKLKSRIKYSFARNWKRQWGMKERKANGPLWLSSLPLSLSPLSDNIREGTRENERARKGNNLVVQGWKWTPRTVRWVKKRENYFFTKGDEQFEHSQVKETTQLSSAKCPWQPILRRHTSRTALGEQKGKTLQQKGGSRYCLATQFVCRNNFTHS